VITRFAPCLANSRPWPPLSAWKFPRSRSRRCAHSRPRTGPTGMPLRVLRYASGVAGADRADLLAAYAFEAQASGDYEASIAALQDAIEFRRSLGDRLRAGDHLARLTMPYISLGRNAEAEAASRAAIEILETLPASPELATAYGLQGVHRMIRRDNRDAVSWVGRR
jgi:tetratricopeptide (TPR) repeat protein